MKTLSPMMRLGFIAAAILALSLTIGSALEYGKALDLLRDQLRLYQAASIPVDSLFKH